ncbi:hypothetical protein P3X46_009743 [Hevea brasiliensis]|uniref:Uncharacterized protein n=1 Tax=Hevea brasiliensis TaxID=3981 RepID=A0ABQ9MNB7_HEVBR|nr:hypothetical protein P3X46_009743 [Hevea brasiliensis]
MRASPLYAFADLDVGLPKKVETKEKTIEAIIELPPPSQPTETNLLANLVAIQGLFPPNITVPGWKPGMSVVLPTDLPPPPPGWKLGSPLPPIESLPVPRMVEQQL